MPGMMDTVLNLGINDKTEEGLAKKTGSHRFAADVHRRFIQMFSNVVLGVSHHLFEEAIKRKKTKKNIIDDTDLSQSDLQELIQEFKDIAEEVIGKKFPNDAYDQLDASIKAVFRSWNSERAKKYREIHKIPNDLGTAVNIQSMVFGNTGSTSGTGVAFTRNPSTGEKKFFGDFLMNAQGEDVVAGIRTPREIAELGEEMPEVYSQLITLQEKLEKHFREMQDIEFTIEEGKLFLLQTRTGKRTSAAAVRIAVEMVREELITKEEALLRLNPDSLNTLLHPSLDPNAKKNVITIGIAASPGAASGKVVFNADDAVEQTQQGNPVILVRHETSPEDIHGMHVSEGILTACGGKASHAAVVARGMGKSCVSGAAEVIVNTKLKKFTTGKHTVSEGDIITLDGGTGEVILGSVPTLPAQLSESFKTILTWADDVRHLQIRANADTPEDVQNARKFGAEGIGLCRTEHMFFSDERIHHVRRMILARSSEEREKALRSLLSYQRSDFEKIFDIMDGLPVTIRLLDPPLHEFLPKKDADIEELSTGLGLSYDEMQNRIRHLTEMNPMLGHRGCRLLITCPEILKIQTQAIIEAAINVSEKGKKVLPEIMVPLIGTPKELCFCREIIEKKGEELFTKRNKKIQYQIGTMIELPRACITAEAISSCADFFSFGTNDLTQMTFGFSRDDVGQFLPQYLQQGILSSDPFEIVDTGVQELIKIGIKKGRKQKKDLKISVCGEHGGNPESIQFFNDEDITVVSCSPFRVPIARLAAAQAVLRSRQ
jgi:pyruvate,orthophosphate dikinase